MNRRGTALLLLSLGALSCSSSDGLLTVDVITDFSPGAEFLAVRTQIIDGPEETVGADATADFRRGHRVASFGDGVGEGEVTVRVELLRPSGGVLASQTRTGTLAGPLTVTMVFTRNCLGLRCPSGQSCVDAECVDDTCNPAEPATCPDSVLCASADDCVRPGLAECATASCIQFLCLVETDESLCGEGLYCNAETGCAPRLMPGDGGVDGGTECGDACGGGGPCRTGVIDCSGPTRVCVESNLEAGTPCSVGAEAGTCDDGGSCTVGCVEGAPCPRTSACELGITRCATGVAVCEANGVAEAGAVCREAQGLCDVEEVCDGVSVQCPTNEFAATGDSCRPSAGPCDVEDVCDGSSAACPADALESAGSRCPSGFCNGLVAACQSGCTPGAPCDTGNPCEVGGFDCSGPPACVASANRPDGTMCGDPTFGAWSSCGSFMGTCDTTGQRTRMETYRECQGGSCTDRTATGSDSCSRNTNGEMCGMTSCPAFGACGGYSNMCDTTGTQSRTCTDRACGGGSCGNVSRSESRACSRTLTEACGDLLDTDCDGTCDEGCRVPVHRGLRGADHFYTRSMSELVGAGYTYEGVAFYVYAASHPGLIPYYRCRVGGDHWMSRSSTCDGTVVEGVIGYVRAPTQPSCGSTPLYRLFSTAPDHFYTTSAAERDSAIPPYILEGTDAQVWRTP